MTEIGRSDALGFASMSLRTPDDGDLLATLLEVAAGRDVVDRSMSANQFAALDRHRLVPLVPTTWAVDDDSDLISTRQRSIAMSELRRRHAMREVLALLDSRNLECRVLKGLATSQLDYERPSQRETGDIDILVRPADFRAAASALADVGATAQPAPGHGIGKGAAFDLDRDVIVDLHWRLSFFSEQHAHTLFAEPVALPHSGGFAMPAELRLVHAAAHLVYTPPGRRLLSGLADITAIRSRSDVDVDRARGLARKLGVEGVVSAALRFEGSLTGRSSSELDNWQQPSRLERWAFVRAERQLAAEYWLALLAVPGVRNRARYLWYLATVPMLRGDADNYWAYLRRPLPRRLGGQHRYPTLR